MEDETPKFTMADFYKVLRWLQTSKVDRQEPCDFKQIIVEDNEIVIPTIYGTFNGVDYVEIFLNCHGHDIDVPSVKLGFSPLVNGNASILSLNAKNDIINPDEDTCIRFNVDENYSARDESRLLTGISSLKLSFNEDVTGLEIQKIYMRSVDYTYVLEDLQVACESGKSYVLRKLNDRNKELNEITDIPESLKHYVYMAAGAFAWLVKWEYESKPMKENKSESLNYADRLLMQVDLGISEYMNNIENNRNDEYLGLNTLATSDVSWGL